MTEAEWKRLMAQARLRASRLRERQRIVAVIQSPRAQRYTGHKWAYVICVPESNGGFRG